MVFDFDSGALLGRYYPLDDGIRVGLRLARSSDAGAIRQLLARQTESDGGVPRGDFELARMISFDPRSRCVLVATGLLDGVEQLVGLGSIELGDQREAHPEPDLLLIDPDAPESLRALLTDALISRAQAVARARAA